MPAGPLPLCLVVLYLREIASSLAMTLYSCFAFNFQLFFSSLCSLCASTGSAQVSVVNFILFFFQLSTSNFQLFFKQ
jgi:hypothetical protein